MRGGAGTLGLEDLATCRPKPVAWALVATSRLILRPNNAIVIKKISITTICNS